MANSKHVFVQLDTDSIIAGYEELLKKTKGKLNKADRKHKKINNEALITLTKMHTLLFTQGSMAMGNPTEDFTVDVDLNADVYFSILPLELFSYHHLYFTFFECNNVRPKTKPSLSEKNSHVSFKITCDVEEVVNYTLGIQLKYKVFVGKDKSCKPKEKSIRLILDPKLRVRQTAG